MAIELKVPEVGESITEVYIGDWHKSEGERVERDEEIVELESEKATFDAPAPAAGVLSKILKQTGETAEVGEVIAHIEPSEEPSGEGDGRKKAPAEESQQEPAGGEVTREEEPPEERKTPKERPREKEAAGARAETHGEIRIMPAARRLLAEHGLDPGDVEATGPGNRLLKQDVQRHIDQQQQERAQRAAPSQRARQETPEAGREEETVRMSPVRRRIAQRLVEAQKNAALLTTFNEIDMTAVSTLRNEFRDAFLEKYDVKLGFMSFFVKACVDALKQFPEINASVREKEIVYHNYYDIGIAIGAEQGLVVPVLRNVERLSFAEIELAINDFAERAQQGKLSISELQGGTFTISNGGVYGSLMSTPIVNPPQSGVLGMHAIQERPVVRDGEIVVRSMMYVALTYDHRLVDGRGAVRFLRRIKETIEEPARMLIEV